MIRFCDEGIPAQHDTVQFIHIRVAAGHKDDRHIGESPNWGADLKATVLR